MATGSIAPFNPLNSTVLAATSSFQAVNIPTGDSVLFYNSSAAVCQVSFVGGSTIYIPPGGRMMVAGTQFVQQALIDVASGTGNVYIMAGNGTAY